MAQSVRSTTLIHGVVGSILAVTLSVLPKLGGWMIDSVSGIGQAKNCPTKSDLHLGKVHSVDYCSMKPCSLSLWVLLQGRNASVHESRIEKAVYITLQSAIVEKLSNL